MLGFGAPMVLPISLYLNLIVPDCNVYRNGFLVHVLYVFVHRLGTIFYPILTAATPGFSVRSFRVPLEAVRFCATF